MSFTLWMTGLPSIGKSTTAKQVYNTLLDNGCQVELMDSDEHRVHFEEMLSKDASARDIVARSMAVTAMYLNRRSIICICVATSPRRLVRDTHRKLIKGYIEVYCQGTVETARKRDTRGLYSLADKGIIKGFTGVDEVYEAPRKPELVLDMESLSPAGCVQVVMKYLEDHLNVR